VRDNGSVIKTNKLLVTDDNRRGVDNDLFNVTFYVNGDVIKRKNVL
jgi:hypothetical protein